MLTRHIDLLREAICKVRKTHPFELHAFVVLSEHLHCVLQLPEGDCDFTLLWRLIKASFSKSLPIIEKRSAVRVRRGERGIWQRRFWEHVIKDEADYAAHMDYVHINPVKHGLVKNVRDWPYSTFHHCVRQGIYTLEWAGSDKDNVLGYDD